MLMRNYEQAMNIKALGRTEQLSIGRTKTDCRSPLHRNFQRTVYPNLSTSSTSFLVYEISLVLSSEHLEFTVFSSWEPFRPAVRLFDSYLGLRLENVFSAIKESTSGVYHSDDIFVVSLMPKMNMLNTRNTAKNMGRISMLNVFVSAKICLIHFSLIIFRTN